MGAVQGALRDDAVLVVGAQRSGTTLMRLILESHERFRCFDEVTAYDVLAEGSVDDDPRRPVFKIPRFTEQIDAPVWRDYGAPESAGCYSGQHMIFMLREPRDVVASMLQLAGGVWCDVWVRPILDDRAGRDPSFAARWRRDRSFCESTPHPRESICAYYWLYKTEALQRYQAAGLPVHAVPYERLVTAPESTLRGLLAALNEGWDDRVLDHCGADHAELDAIGRTVGGTDPTRPIDDAGIGRWYDALKPDAAECVRHITLPLWNWVSAL